VYSPKLIPGFEKQSSLSKRSNVVSVCIASGGNSWGGGGGGNALGSG
jgi:hypothetical protein